MLGNWGKMGPGNKLKNQTCIGRRIWDGRDGE